MNRRILAAIAATVLAAAGAVTLFLYLTSAEAAAKARWSPTNVLVVVAPVARGTAAEALGDKVAIRQVPQASVVNGSVTNVTELIGKVAFTDLVPGEQVLASRFIDPQVYANTTDVEVPKGMQQLSLALETQRVIGGRLSKGDLVGVFITAKEPTPATRLALHKILVSRVDGGTSDADTPAAQAASKASEVATGKIMVTLVVNASDAQKIVWAMENGSVWLGLENTESTDAGATVVTAESVLR